MIGLLCFILAVLASPFKSKLRLEAENAVLRHQLIVLRRRPHGRIRLTNHDRLFFIQLYRWFPAIQKVLTIIRLETLVRWHRAGFRCYWRWKSRSRASPSTWSNGGDHPARDGEPSCVIMLQTLPPWTCLLSRPLASICSMPSLSCGSIVGTSRGSASQPTRQQSGLHVR